MKNYKDQQTILPYLMLVNAKEFIGFAQIVLDAEVILQKLANDNQTVLVAELKIGNTIILLSDAQDKYGRAFGNFFIYVDDVDLTFQTAINHGASVVTEIADMSYGRSGGIEDPFGNTWWLTTI